MIRPIHSDAAEFYAILAYLADLAVQQSEAARSSRDMNAENTWLVLCELIESAEQHAAEMVGVDVATCN